MSGLRLFGYCPRPVARRLAGVPIALALAALLVLSSRLLPERCVYNEMGRVSASGAQSSPVIGACR